MSDSGDRSWSIRERGELVWRCWENEYLLYDSFSGDIHVLDCIAGTLLECLKSSPASEEALTTQVADVLDAEIDSELLSVTRQTLNKLSSLQLVHCQS